MSGGTCWKCSRELPEGQVECEDDCKRAQAQSQSSRPQRTHIPPAAKPTNVELVFVDWDKVGVEELKKIIKAFCPELSIVKGSPMELEWKDFLKKLE